MTPDKLVEELDRRCKVPGLANIWVPPIRNRIDMLATGIKSPVGVKVAGTDLAEIDRITVEIETAKDVPGGQQALAERLTGGRYVDVTSTATPRRATALNIADVQSVISRRGRWREHRRDRRRPAALPDQPALSARTARLAGGTARVAHRHARGQRLSAVGRGRIAHHRRPADAAQRERPACPAGSTWTSAGATCSAVQGDMQRVVAEQVDLPPGYRSRGPGSSSSWSAPPPGSSWWCRSRC
jgi:Cu(I)/Ag(I) efflux system membrane protein CusA/SilA